MAIAVLLGFTAGIRAEDPPPDPSVLFRKGLSEYEDGRFQEGVTLFSKALDSVGDPPSIDKAMIHYNLGVGYFRLSQPDKAAVSFQEALRTPDLPLQSSAYFNLGNSQYQSGQKALEEGDVAHAFTLYQAASSNYMQSLRLNTADRDAKINYELALAGQMRILQWVAQAMRHVKQGDQLVGEYRFAEAAAWFQQNYEAIDKALTLEPELKKQFEQMSQRTAAVAEIANPTPVEESGP